jgi:hypothetical protein
MVKMEKKINESLANELLPAIYLTGVNRDQRINGNQTPTLLRLEDDDRVYRSEVINPPSKIDIQEPKEPKRHQTAPPSSSQARGEQIGRERVLFTSSKLQDHLLGMRYCDETELLSLLLAQGLVHRVRTIQVEVGPLGGDSFKVTLNMADATVKAAKEEIERIQGTEQTLQELYKVAVRADGRAVREDDAEPEALDDDSTELKDGEVLALAVTGTISIRVVDGPSRGSHIQNETLFKVKMTSRMEELFNAYAERKEVSVGFFRFSLDGQRINGDQTVGSLDFDEQALMDGKLTLEVTVATITIRVRDPVVAHANPYGEPLDHQPLADTYFKVSGLHLYTFSNLCVLPLCILGSYPPSYIRWIVSYRYA